jgi:hypothetical protein
MGCILATMAPAFPTERAIEALFRPSTRSGDRLPYGFTEVELLPGLTVENVLVTGVMWKEFRRFLQGKRVWMAPNVYVCSQDMGHLAESVLSLGGNDANES